MASIEQLQIKGAGVDLVADVAGDRNGEPILFLHGGGQTRHSWRKALDEAARRGYRGISLDLRGHGESDWSPDKIYSLERFVADVRQAIEQIGGTPIIVGASLGGIIGMLIAAAPPPPVRALVLVDVAPRIEMEGAKEIGAFMGSAPEGFASVEEAADAVSAYLPHRARPKDTSGLLRNLRLRDGRYYWHWDPAFREMEKGAEEMMRHPNPLATAAAALTLPTLLIRGRLSRIVSPESVREFRELVPHAEYVDIAGADHMVAGDANDAFNEATFAFIERQIAPART